MQHTFKCFLLAILVVFSVQAEDEFRQHNAHQHGYVEFNIAQDDNELLVEITAPSSDIVGFEHAPETPQQHDQLKKAKQILKHADNILLLSSVAGCKLEEVDIDIDIDEHESEHHNHHKKHDHHNKHRDHEKNGHSEFSIEYHFECDDISKLNQIETTWFNRFPRTEKIQVHLLTDTVQRSITLDSSHQKIQL